MAEEVALEAASRLKESKKIRDFKDLRKTKFDAEAKDLLIIDLSGEEIFIQIKSSDRGAIKHRRTHPEIPVLIIKEKDFNNIPLVMKHILSLIYRKSGK